MKEITAEQHISNCFDKFAVFDGKASRPEFWFFYLFFTIAQVVAYFIDLKVFGVESGFGVITILVSAILFIPMLSVGARRLHDINKSGWWQLLMITGIGSIPLIIMWCMEGEIKSNIKHSNNSNKINHSNNPYKISSNNYYKPKAKSNNEIQIFDVNYERDDYIKRFLPEISKNYNDYLKKIKSPTDTATKKKLVKNFKYNFKSKDKYWNTENIYPQNENNFIEEFFQGRKLDLLEGIWDEDKWGLVGIVKDKSFYQHYDIDITQKLYDKFQKSHIDYSMVNGTKSGAHFKTSNKKKFKGFGRVVHVLNENKEYNFDVKQIMIQPTTTEMTIIDENNLQVRLSGYDNRLVKYERVWPLNFKKHNESLNLSNDINDDTSGRNITKELKDLKKLYKDGTLSKTEFTKAKNKLLK